MEYLYLDYEQQNNLVKRSIAGDRDATEKLIAFLTPFANKIAAGFVTEEFPFEDLVQEAVCGIMMAIPRYQPEKGAKFSTYCSFWMRKMIREYVSPVSSISTLNKYNRFIQDYVIKHCHEPSDETIINELHITKKTLQQFKLISMPTSSFEANMLDSEANEESFENHLMITVLLENALELLSDDEKTVMIHYWGLFETKGKTFKEVGEMFGYSKEWARLIEQGAREKIRTHLNEIGILSPF